MAGPFIASSSALAFSPRASTASQRALIAAAEVVVRIDSFSWALAAASVAAPAKAGPEERMEPAIRTAIGRRFMQRLLNSSIGLR